MKHFFAKTPFSFIRKIKNHTNQRHRFCLITFEITFAP